MSDKKLTNTLHKKFVAEYLIDGNAKEAAIRAGYSPKTAAQQGYRLTQRADIQAAIAEATAEYVKSCHITKDMVLLKWWQIANADYNELTQLRRLNCRYCWGIDHEYQWTPKEYERACAKAVEDNEPEPHNAGGIDYDRNKGANPDCPECSGHGIEHVYFADTTKLSAQAKLLFQGVKETKSGIEVMTADRMKALDNVARHLGMFKDTVNHVSEDGSMTPVFNIVGVSPDDKSASGDSTE